MSGQYVIPEENQKLGVLLAIDREVSLKNLDWLKEWGMHLGGNRTYPRNATLRDL